MSREIVLVTTFEEKVVIDLPALRERVTAAGREWGLCFVQDTPTQTSEVALVTDVTLTEVDGHEADQHVQELIQQTLIDLTLDIPTMRTTLIPSKSPARVARQR